MSRVARNVVVVFAQQILGALGGAVGAFYIARHMDNPSFALGFVQFALAVGAMFSVVLRAFDTAHVKRVSAGLDEARCNGTYIALKAASAVAYVAVLESGIFAWTHLLPALTDGRVGGGFQTPLHATALQLAIVYYLLNGIGEVPRRMYEARQNVVVGQIVLSTEHVVKTGLTVYVALGGFGALALVWSFVIGAACLAVVGVAYAVRRPVGRPSRELARSYLRFSRPKFAGEAFGAINMYVGVVIVQLFWTTSEVGYLGAPLRLVQVVTALGAAVATSLLPVISLRHSQGQGSADLVTRSMHLAFAAIAPVVAVLVAAPRGFIHVFLSDDFMPAASVLRILTLAALVGALQMTLASKLFGIDRPEVSTRLTFVLGTFTMLLHMLLVPQTVFGLRLAGLGADGAAYARLIASVAGFIVASIVVERLAGVPFPTHLWKHVLATGTATAAVRGFILVVPELSFRVWHAAAAGLVALVAFWAALAVLRGISADDKALFRLLSHPREWARFAADEARAPR